MLTGISVLLWHTFIKKHKDLVNSNYVYFVANAPEAPDGRKLADLGFVGPERRRSQETEERETVSGPGPDRSGVGGPPGP